MSDLIASIAADLLRTDLDGAPAATRRVMRTLVENLGVDIAFLRLHDHRRRTTALYAEWPPRSTVPHADPLGVVPFDRATPVIALGETLTETVELRGQVLRGDHHILLAESGATPPETILMVPVLSATGTTLGVVALGSYADRAWTPEQHRTMTTVAAFLAMTHARLVAQLRLQRGADRDPLTRLPNRTALLSHLADRLSAQDPAPVVALMVRSSEAFTECLEPGVVDDYVIALTERLGVAILGSGTVFRTAADEFVVVPLHGNTSDARRMAVGLQAVLEAPLPMGDTVVSPRVHVGIASAFRDSPNPVALLEGLRHAVEHAGAAGGQNITVLDRSIVRTAKRRNDIEAGIRDAVAEGALRLDYQPEVDLRTRQIVGMEALVRWPHPTLGELPPESFLDVVESMNLADDLGRWVLRKACVDLSQWRTAGLAERAMMRVNVSPRQLVDPGFADSIAELLTEFGIGPGLLCVEFTETVMLHDMDEVRALCERLHAVGVKIAIDDFGTGYSGFTRLKALPIDAVKIDRSFVRDVEVNLHDRAIVAAVTTMAAAFDIDVVAEGVETEGAAATLLELGCTHAQGFLFSRPVDAATMRDLLDPAHVSEPSPP